jgi:dihydroanticapsin dehydrogenase
MASVVITGGATGIGAAAVRTFAAAGYDVALLDINGEASRALEGETHPGRVVFFETDVSKRPLSSSARPRCSLPMPAYRSCRVCLI